MSKVENVHLFPTPFSLWGRLAANCAAHMTEHLFNGVIVVVLPIITASLGLSLAQAGALASARTLLAGVASFPSGFFADLASRRNLMLGLCIATIGFASFGLSTSSSFSMLMIFMALAGFGSGWFHPQSLAILSAKYRDKKAFALGVHDSSANLGEVIGPLAIGLLVNFFDWRTALQVWAIPGLAIGITYAFCGAEGNSVVPRAKDYRRAVWEDVLKNKSIFGLVAVSTLRAMGQTALAAFLPLYLVLHLQLSAGAAGAYMSILFLFAGAAPAVVGWISDRFGHRLLIVGFSFLSFVTIAAIPHLGSGLILAVGLGALGALLWALRPVIVSAAMSAAPQHLAGSIVAVIYGANMGVSFLAPVAAGLIADRYGLPIALTSIAVFPLLAATICFLVVAPPVRQNK
ncbi:MAG TPA: MFS transporter [Candidatus Binatia bacterium]|jgi:FSR family fosmidomycin resistance protein-like MFS transporter